MQNQFNITDKLPQFGSTIFTTMSVLAQEHNAINLGQGFPDFPMPTKLTEAFTKAMNNGNNQYTHMNGLPILREKIANKIKYLYYKSVDFNTEITITPGGTYAIYSAITALINKGDEAIIFEPAYDSYLPNIIINGGVAIPIELSYPNYEINWEIVKSKINSKTKLIIINSPHNPTGNILSKNDIDSLYEIVKDTNIIIISDEVYEHLIFDNQQHHSILAHDELFKRSFVIFSFGKVYHCTGWKMGYCVAPENLMYLFRKVHMFNAFTCNTPAQYALAEMLDDEDHYNNLGKELQQKRDLLITLLKDTKLEPLPSSGSYFQLYSYANISAEDELSFAKKLTIENGVTTIPVSAFYSSPINNKVLRFCFAKSEATLQAAAERLRKL